MKDHLLSLIGPIGAILFLLGLLLLLVFLPNPLQLKRTGALAHNAPLVLRHAPAPVLRHVRDVAHRPPH